MDQILFIVGAVAAAWLAVSVIVALGFGRAVRIAEVKDRDRFAYVRTIHRVPARAR